MTESRSRIYLVHIRLDRSDASTIRARAPLLRAAVEALSNHMIPAYASADAGTFGFLVTSDHGAYTIRGNLQNDGQVLGDTGFRNGDSVLVLEIGEHVSQLGFSQAQHFVDKWYGK